MKQENSEPKSTKSQDNETAIHGALIGGLVLAALPFLPIVAIIGLAKVAEFIEEEPNISDSEARGNNE